MEASMVKRISLMILVTFVALGVQAQQGDTVAEIVVRGNQRVSTDAITSAMRTKVGGPYQPRLLLEDQQTLQALPFFSDVKVFAEQIEPGKWRVVVQVVEWPLIKKIVIEGVSLFSEEEVKGKLRNKEGAPFDPRFLAGDAREIIRMYREKGYFATVEKYEPSDGDPETIVVEIREVRVRNIVINGLTKTQRSVIDKLTDTKPGALFHQPTWGQDLRRLWDTQFFESLEPDSQEPEAGLVDLILNVREARTGMFNAGLSVDPRNRLAAMVSLSETNLYGTGKSLSIFLLQSAQGLGTSFSVDYNDPFVDRKRSTFGVSLYSRESLVFGQSFLGGGGFQLDSRFAQRRTGARLSYSRALTNDIRAFVALRGEGINTENFTPRAPYERVVAMDGTVAGISLGVTRNRRDNAIDPARGDWIKISLEPSYGKITSVGGARSGFDILGENFFTKGTVDYRYYWSPQPPRAPDKLDEPRRVVAFRANLGNIQGKVPFFEQFFVGGAYGPRGYPEDRFWGRTMMLFQLEYRHPIQKSFNIVAFVDYGGAWDGYGTIRDFTQKGVMSMHIGYGFGINFRTPLGPIRLDVGFDENGKTRTHFLIGGSF